MKETLVEEDPSLKGIDRIYNYVSQRHPFPLLLYNALAMITWAAGGYSIISISFSNAKPDFITCNDGINNETLSYNDYCSSNITCNEAQLKYGFNNDWIDSTLVTHYHLICDQAGAIKNAKSMQMAGFFIAAVVQGFVSDKFGRRTGLITFCLGGSLLFLLNGLLQTTSYYAYITLQLLVVAVINASCLTHFVYGMEIIGPNYRSAAGMLAQCFFSLGFMLLTPAAMLVNKTAGLMYIGAAIPLLILATLPFLRESFRWQFANGMFAEGMATLKIYVSKCGQKLDEEVLETLIDTDDQAQEPAKMSDLLKSSTMLKISLQMAFIWIVTTLTYYKLAIGENSGNMLMDNVFSGLTEIVFLVPGAWCLQQKWCQRRWFLGILFFIAGVGLALDSMFTTMYHRDEMAENASLYFQLARICRLPGRGAITVVFACIFVYSTEIYPTSVRSTGLGFCSFCARIGGIISPQIDRLTEDPINCIWGPGAVVATLSFMACAVSFMCPETLGMKVLETMDEANEQYTKREKK